MDSPCSSKLLYIYVCVCVCVCVIIYVMGIYIYSLLFCCALFVIMKTDI